VVFGEAVVCLEVRNLEVPAEAEDFLVDFLLVPAHDGKRNDHHGQAQRNAGHPMRATVAEKDCPCFWRMRVAMNEGRLKAGTGMTG
jgi:hypothetical protein